MLIVVHKYFLLFSGSLLTCFFLIACVRVKAQITDSLAYHRAELKELFKAKPLTSSDTSKRIENGIIKETIPAFQKKALLKRLHEDSVLHRLYSWNRKFHPVQDVFSLTNAAVGYNFSYRSNVDTPYFGSNISQHLANFNADIMLANKFPFRFGLYARRSNSPYFRNYTDVRLEFNTSEFKRFRSEQIVKSFKSLVAGYEDSSLPGQIGKNLKQVTSIQNYLNNPELIKRFLQSRERMINRSELVGTRDFKDSVLRADSLFVKLYEEKQSQSKKIQTTLDSLKNEYTITEKKMQKLQHLFDHNLFRPGGTEVILQNLHAAGIHDRHFERMLHSLNSIRSFTIGRTMPDYTDLTIENIAINGINVEYNQSRLYLAFVAGLVDFRTRDFIFASNKPTRQYVTAGRVGWGAKEGNHLIFTGYSGRKQLLYSGTQNYSDVIYGLSAEAQFIVSKNLRLTGEIAQSAFSPRDPVPDSALKGFSFKDNSSKAWSLNLHSFFPKTRTGVEGYYEQQGINFQCFNAYKINARTTSYNLKADQYLFKGSLHITGAINKNGYSNPFFIQNNTTNTVFKTVNLSFRKRFWPSVSIGYIPSSQFCIVNGRIFQSYYQSFNINSSYIYRLGNAKTMATVLFNHFYNDSRDSGFIFYNAQNTFVGQNIFFEKYSANISISHTRNTQYSLDVMEAGLSKSFGNASNVSLGGKLSHLNTNENELGYYVRARTRLRKIGTINISAEKTYLPGLAFKLVRNEFVNIGFTRLIK